MREPHLDFLAFAARLLKGFSVGERTNMVSRILVDIARDLASVGRRTPRLELASCAVIHASPVRQNTALIDETIVGEQLTRWADVYVALPIKHKIRSAELAVGPA